MATTLRRLLQAFEETETTMRFDELCRVLDVDAGTLDSMLQHWIRKGRIREVSGGGDSCNACGINGECPFVMRLPRHYELVRSDSPPVACSCSRT